jgi:hypothetical protein
MPSTMRTIPTLGGRVTPNFRPVETTLETDDGDIDPLNLYYQPAPNNLDKYKRPNNIDLYLRPS